MIIDLRTCREIRVSKPGWKYIITIGRACRSGGIIFGCALASVTWADSLPAAVTACATETNSDERLACYDRAVAPIVMRAEPARVQPAAPDASQGKGTDPAAQEPQHIKGHVLSLEGTGGDHMVVHLENGQTWEQSGPSSDGLELRKGDVVEIDRALGSWWLSGRQGDAIKVRRKE